MFSGLLSVLAVAPLVVGGVAGIEAGQQLVYRGSVTPRVAETGQGEPQKKAFDLTWFVAAANESGAKLYWLVEERGRGAWRWPERFGLVTLDSQGHPQGAIPPSLFYDYGEGESVVPLPLPIVELAQPLTGGAKWSHAGQEYEVQAEQKADGRDAWQLRVRNNYGLKRTMLVDKSAPLLLSLNERVFMNKGTEYALELERVSLERPAATEQAATVAMLAALVELRAKLHRPPQSADVEWNTEQLALLSVELPELEKRAAGGPLARLVTVAARDAKLQGGRADEVAQLTAEHQGQPLAAISLAGLAGGTLTNADLADHVTVLHFWDYRDEPLKEPYGQVGYLEFLYQKRKDQGVKIFGVAVDGRLNDDAGRRAAIASVRKLKAFMNLTYPLALDGGAGIKAVGDPRLVGATLPLVLVIGRDGRVTHFHTGYYEVDRQEGLKELDAAVGAALGK
jgi:hypothetical protein